MGKVTTMSIIKKGAKDPKQSVSGRPGNLSLPSPRSVMLHMIEKLPRVSLLYQEAD